ncbi:hypothetical protein STXM2123_2030 [Streptomyces sp. F-3]|uniref:DUF8017 domain-containing protein n=1 Tax=Streptomyces thermogriseus TaxID=75292 RepID=A0ABP4DJM6_9ACTN|nr:MULTISPECIES: hypothetical protein [Streptomyces]MDN5383786.1 hypothetical protein [Streptomyces sp. LB8]GAT81329.1 hypothetical protein STXM2123_2030 [Streptomyces sp. F-3]
MWPGQQPPGGEQNPQNNPYQQPGYQQPNPYQQPGYQQPNPYAQQPQWSAPTVPMDKAQPPQGSGGGDNRTKLVAIVSATAVVVTAAVTGFLVLGGDKDDKAGGTADPKASQSASADASAEPSDSPSVSDDNPRGTETVEPTIPGWKVVINPKRGVAFDVPADWEVQSPGLSIGFEDKDGKPLTIMSGVAKYKSKWCTSDDDKDGRSEDTALAAVGSKGAEGAKDTDEVAVNTVAWWVYGGYTQPDKKSLTFDKKAKPYTTKSGIKGSIAWAQSNNTPQKGKCASDGKALTFGFKNSAGDFVAWNFYGAKGVKEEVPTETIMRILSTVRLHGEPTG